MGFAMRILLLQCLGCLTAGILAQVDAAELQRPQKPHLITLVLDDIGWADIGAHGSNFPTPNIDKLLNESVELKRMYAMPQCSPTRSAILTGKWAWTIGMQHWNTIMPGVPAGIPATAKTLAEVLKDAGYATHAIGKWHLGYSSWSQTPIGRGFDTYLGYLQGQTNYYNRTIPSCGAAPCLFKANCEGTFTTKYQACSKPMESPYGLQADSYDFWDGKRLMVEELGKYTQRSYMGRFEELLKEYNTSASLLSTTGETPKPLYVYFAQQLLHVPLQLPDDPRHAEACRNVKGGSASVNRTVLCAMASQLDESIGEMMRLLKNYGLYDNTLVWAYSDNGGMTHWADTFPASASSNWPLRGGKTTLFEGGVRSVSWVSGGVLPASARGTKRNELLHAVDILPTMSALAGVSAQDLPEALNGEDVWGTIIGAEGHITNRTELPLNVAINRDLAQTAIPQYTHHPHTTNYTAMISWPWKIIIGNAFIAGGAVAVDIDVGGWWTVEDYEYVPPPMGETGGTTDAGVLLFNLETDESEQHNVAWENPEVVEELSKRVSEKYLTKESGYVPPQLNVPRLQANPRYHEWSWAPFWHLEGEAVLMI